MNAKILAMGLIGATAAAVALYPTLRSDAASGVSQIAPQEPVAKARIEAVFVLDTTGSMSGLIHAAKEKIWSIATTMAQADPAPEIRIGLVGYRDRGDAYVTRIVDLSEDLDSMYAALMGFAADGGGDTPESVNRALDDAVNALSWSAGQDTYKVAFLVGDAPPQAYQDEPGYAAVVAAARAKGIVVNTIQCGSLEETVAPWRHIAALGGGRYFQVAQAGSAIAIQTPFDAEIARLSAELDGTRMLYGSTGELVAAQTKLDAIAQLEASASVEARARRGLFNATASGVRNLGAAPDLVADVADGRVRVTDVPTEELPPALAPLPPEERERAVAAVARQREDLQRRIAALGGERDAYVADAIAKAGGAADSLDVQIYEAVRDQAAPKGLRYERGPTF